MPKFSIVLLTLILKTFKLFKIFASKIFGTNKNKIVGDNYSSKAEKIV